MVIPAPKFPVGFHLSDFNPSKAQVDSGETVTLGGRGQMAASCGWSSPLAAPCPGASP